MAVTDRLYIYMYSIPQFIQLASGGLSGLAMDDGPSEYTLDDKEYSTACELARGGKTKELKRFLQKTLKNKGVGLRTFLADSTTAVRKFSPFTLAARYGRAHTVQWLLDNYCPKAIDLNPGAGEDPQQKKELRHDLPLYWVCLNGHLEIARRLVSAGAQVNLSNCMLATPLHAAASNGHVKMIKFLMSKGAEVDAIDLNGNSPLIAAACGGHSRAMCCLLEAKADSNLRTVDGYTAMHVAAKEGHLEVVSILLENGISPMFGEATPEVEGYVPCPLFLAAGNGHTGVVSELLSHEDCSKMCKIDALELVSIGRHKNNRQFMKLSELELMHVNNHPDKCIQIAERCLGCGNAIITEMWLGIERLDFKDFRLPGGNQKWEHAVLKKALQNWQRQIKTSIFPEPVTVQTALEIFLLRFNPQIFRMFPKELDVTMLRNAATLGLEVLEVSLLVQEKHKCEVVGGGNRSVLCFLLYIILLWLNKDHEGSAVSCAEFVGPQECEELGKKLVDGYLIYAEEASLLHLALSDVKKIYYLTYLTLQLGLLIRALLRWGADAAIDLPDWNGQRPLHLAVRLINNPVLHEAAVDVMAPLVEFGAHLDLVNREGKTALSLCRSDEEREMLMPSEPLRLSCIACHKIVIEEIPYRKLNIPPFVKGVIRDHDWKLY